jgi:hypothetical protein
VRPTTCRVHGSGQVSSLCMIFNVICHKYHCVEQAGLFCRELLIPIPDQNDLTM